MASHKNSQAEVILQVTQGRLLCHRGDYLEAFWKETWIPHHLPGVFHKHLVGSSWDQAPRWAYRSGFCVAWNYALRVDYRVRESWYLKNKERIVSLQMGQDYPQEEHCFESLLAHRQVGAGTTKLHSVCQGPKMSSLENSLAGEVRFSFWPLQPTLSTRVKHPQNVSPWANYFLVSPPR